MNWIFLIRWHDSTSLPWYYSSRVPVGGGGGRWEHVIVKLLVLYHLEDVLIFSAAVALFGSICTYSSVSFTPSIAYLESHGIRQVFSNSKDIILLTNFADTDMATHGNAWQRMVTHGNAWQRMATHGNAWQRMAKHGNGQTLPAAMQKFLFFSDFVELYLCYFKIYVLFPAVSVGLPGQYKNLKLP